MWLQLVAGLSVVWAGLVLVPLQFAMALATLSAPWLASRARPATVMAGRLVLGAGGQAALVGIGVDTPVAVVIGGFLFASVGVAMPAALGTDLVVGSVPTEKAGSAGALSETSGELGIALGVATPGSLATLVHRSALVVPEGTGHAQQLLTSPSGEGTEVRRRVLGFVEGR